MSCFTSDACTSGRRRAGLARGISQPRTSRFAAIFCKPVVVEVIRQACKTGALRGRTAGGAGPAGHVGAARLAAIRSVSIEVEPVRHASHLLTVMRTIASLTGAVGHVLTGSFAAIFRCPIAIEPVGMACEGRTEDIGASCACGLRNVRTMNLAAIAHLAIGIVVARFTNQPGAGLRITALSASGSWHGGAGDLAAILLLPVLVPEISLADVGAASVRSGARRTVGSREAPA